MVSATSQFYLTTTALRSRTFRCCSSSSYRRRLSKFHVVCASSESVSDAEKPSTDDPPTRKRRVDTRIHWSSPDEGWIGEKTKSSGVAGDKKQEPFGARFAELINNANISHYQTLGVSPEVETEDIKSAYRKLSKEYHPDTTSLPLKTASEKFIQLREAYNVLSNEDTRKFYDWTLAQEAESRKAERMRRRLEDPYEQDVQNWEANSVPDMVDRLGGKNMKLSDQAMTALTIDIVIIIFAICSIIYVLVFREPFI